jgi:hypothetical protein
MLSVISPDCQASRLQKGHSFDVINQVKPPILFILSKLCSLLISFVWFVFPIISMGLKLCLAVRMGGS